MRAVILRPAHDVIERILHIQRQALVLERSKARVHRGDQGRGGRKPRLAIRQIRARQAAAAALARSICERPVQPPQAAVVPDEDDVRVERCCRDGVLVRVQANARVVDRHVREVHPGILGALNRAPVRPPADL